MEKDLKQEILKTIDVSRDNVTNSMAIILESYSELLSKLDLLAYLINNEN